MSAKNNTTPIGDGSVGIDSSIQSAAGQAIQEVVSVNNLKANLAANGSLKNVFGATVRMVSRWEPNDKMRIIQSYGYVNQISKNASQSELDNAVATVLVAHLPKEELKRIIGLEETNEKKITKDVYLFNSKAAAKRKQQTMLSNAESRTSGVGGADDVIKHTNNDRDLLKNLKNNKASKKSILKESKEYAKIRKELEDVLNGMTKMQLTVIYNKLKIRSDEESLSKKTMIQQICNKVNAYTILLFDDAHKGVSTADFDHDVIDQVEELLLMTSGGWMTGKVGVNDLTLRAKREAAVAAKKALHNNQEAKKIKEEAKKHIKIKKHKFGSDKGNTKKIELVGFGFNKKKKTKVAAKAEEIKRKLAPLTDDQIQDLAVSQGIEDPENKTREDLIQELSLMAAAEMDQINDKTKDELAKAAKIKDPIKRAQALDKIKANAKTAQKNSILGAVAEGEKGQQEFSDKIPVVTFNQNGELVSTGLLKAVPVYIAGTATKLGKLMSREASDELKKTENAELYNEFGTDLKERINDDANAKGWFKGGKRKQGSNILSKAIDGIPSGGSIPEKIAALQSKLATLDPSSPEYAKVKSELEKLQGFQTGGSVMLGGGGGGGGPMFSTKAGEDAHNDAMANKWGAYKGLMNANKSKLADARKAEETKYARTVNLQQGNADAAIKKFVEENGEDTPIPIKNFIRGDYGYIDKRVKKIFGNATISTKAPVNPVYVVNNGPYDMKTYDTLAKTASTVEDIASDVAQLPILFMGLQQAGMSFNAESAAAGVSKVLQVVSTAASAAASGLKSGFATGGNMRGGNKVSQIITGDHPQGKNNTELVSVDWGSKNINVKPIPMMATGGDAKSNAASNITNVQRMTSSERAKPMIVNIGSGVVTYTKKFDDVHDDGTNTAIKVYSVNSGITEKVKIGDTEISLFDAVYGVYASMNVLVSEMSTNNQLLTAISAASNATYKSINKLASANNTASPFSFTTELDDVLAGR